MVSHSTARTVRSKPIGRAGDWLAEWEGERLPCIHESCLHKLHYHDPFERLCSPVVFNNYVDAIKGGRVILTRTKAHPTKGHAERKKYIALWTVENLEVGRTGPQSIDFDLGNRLVNFVYS